MLQVIGYLVASLLLFLVAMVAASFICTMAGYSHPVYASVLLLVLLMVSYALLHRDPARNFQRIVTAIIVVLLFQMTLLGAIIIFGAVGFTADVLVVLASVVLVYQVLRIEKRFRKLSAEFAEAGGREVCLRLRNLKICAVMREEEENEKERKKRKRKHEERTHSTSLRDVVSMRRERL